MPSKRALRILEEGPECPAALAWIWDLYCDIVRGRSSGGMGAPVLTWQDLEAWSRLHNERLSKFEIDVLFDLDSVQPKEPEVDD